MTDIRIHYNTQAMKDQHDNKESKERNEGPEVTTKYSCVKCKYETSESYRCQGDSGHDVYCTHPSFPVRRRIGDTTWRTPEFCPFRQQTDQNASQETSLLREENEELRRTLTEARQYIATQISSIQYQHAPREYGMVECSKLANAAIAESSIIQTIDKALNPKQ
jgi:hypothetical protein